MSTQQTQREMGDSTLGLAWERFALYSSNAGRFQAQAHRLQRWILTLGVMGTLLAVSQSALKLHRILALDQPLHYVVVVVPIVTSVLLAASIRFNTGSRWVLLRGSAEAIKQEIFRYRARAGVYGDQVGDQPTETASREARLAEKIQSINGQLMQTDVNVASLRPYTGSIPPAMGAAAGGDDGFGVLTPERYLTIRLDDQRLYYEDRSTTLDRQLQVFQWIILVAGGIGTFLAAISQELWIAVTTAVVTALTAYLEYGQIENTLIEYNQTQTSLINVKAWWVALSAQEQADQKNVAKLVEQTEDILAREHSAWTQQMRDALARQREEQQKALASAAEAQTGAGTAPVSATASGEAAPTPGGAPVAVGD